MPVGDDNAPIIRLAQYTGSRSSEDDAGGVETSATAQDPDANDAIDSVLQNLATDPEEESDVEGADPGELTSETIAPADSLRTSEPLLDSPTHILWVGVVGILALMSLIFVVMLKSRGTNNRDDYAGASANNQAPTPPRTDFFAAADDDDDEYVPLQQMDDEIEDIVEVTEEEEDVIRTEVQPKKRGMFGFGKNKTRQSPEEPSDAFYDDRESLNEPERDQSRLTSRPASSLSERERPRIGYDGGIDRQELNEQLDRFADRLEARIEQKLSRAASQINRFDGDDGNDLYSLFSGVEDALSVQSENLKAETRNVLHEFATSFENRLSQQSVGANHSGYTDVNALLQGIDDLFAAHEQGLAKELDDIRALIKNTARPDATDGLHWAQQDPTTQIADALKGVLPAVAYRLGGDVGGNPAAALVKLAPTRPPIAIDASFPETDFQSLLDEIRSPRSAPYADNGNRNAIRTLGNQLSQHIASVKSRLIHPPETTESCFVFLQSESTLDALEHYFPDILHTAARSSIWFVTRKTLPTTVSTIRGLFVGPEHDTQSQEMERRVTSVLAELRAKVDKLESSVGDRASAESKQPSTDRVWQTEDEKTPSHRSVFSHQSSSQDPQNTSPLSSDNRRRLGEGLANNADDRVNSQKEGQTPFPPEDRRPRESRPFIAESTGPEESAGERTGPYNAQHPNGNDGRPTYLDRAPLNASSTEEDPSGEAPVFTKPYTTAYWSRGAHDAEAKSGDETKGASTENNKRERQASGPDQSSEEPDTDERRFPLR
ncbi:MAG: DNA recombination protein RmuC [Pseudomonadota bacterium]